MQGVNSQINKRRDNKIKSVVVVFTKISKIETNWKKMSFRFSNHVLLDCVNDCVVINHNKQSLAITNLSLPMNGDFVNICVGDKVQKRNVDKS